MDFDLFSIGLLDSVDTRAVLKVNGKEFNSWKSININRSIMQIAGSFSFTTSNRFAGENDKWGFTTSDECTVNIAGKRVITGYIDTIEDGYDSNSHDVTFSGRDKTGILVDCPYDVFSQTKVKAVPVNSLSSSKLEPTPPAGEGEFKNQTFLQIIEKLAGSLNVEVELDQRILPSGTAGFNESSLFKAVPNFAIETGAVVHEEITKLCQQFAILPITKGDGKLFLTRAGTEIVNDILEVGVNIKANRFTQTDSERFSIYYATKGQSSTAFNTGLIAEGKILDEYITRYRPSIILIGERNLDPNVCQKRAAWECRIKAGASRTVETTVKGWLQTNDELWPLNGIVSMLDNKIGIKDDLLIAGINLTIDSTGGELTSLSLVHPDTFILKENTPVKKDDGLNAFGRKMKK